MRTHMPSFVLAAALAALPAQAAPTYEEAQRLVLTGRFAEALPALEVLAATTSDPAQQGRIAVLIELCRAWSAGGYALVLAPEAQRIQSVRTTGEMARLYLDGVAYGVGTGGFLAILAESDSAAGVVLPMLLSAGAVGGTLAWLDSRDTFGYGHPRAISTGLLIGMMEGLAWMSWYQAEATYENELDEEGAAGLVWGLSTVGLATGAILGAKLRTTPGRMAFVSSGALWSAAVVGLSAASIVGEEEEADDAFLLATALALNAGAAAAAWLGSELNPSADRVLYLDLGGLAGGLVAGGLYVAIADEDSDVRAGAALTAAGIAGGLATAWILTSDLPPDAPRAGEPPAFSMGMAPLEGGGMLALTGRLD